MAAAAAAAAAAEAAAAEGAEAGLEEWGQDPCFALRLILSGLCPRLWFLPGKLMHFHPYTYNLKYQDKASLETWDVYKDVSSMLNCDCDCKGPAAANQLAYPLPQLSSEQCAITGGVGVSAKEANGVMFSSLRAWGDFDASPTVGSPYQQGGACGGILSAAEQAEVDGCSAISNCIPGVARHGCEGS